MQRRIERRVPYRWLTIGLAQSAGFSVNAPPNPLAQRIHAHIPRVKAGHLSMVADPAVIAKVITAAAKATT